MTLRALLDRWWILLISFYFSTGKCYIELEPSRIITNSDVDPDFSGPINNVTVALGREAVLTCPVTDLAHYKVGWMKAEDQTILSLHTKVVTHNNRISVSHDNQLIWQLHIRQVRESDKGCYMCQINTSVMKKQLGCIDVQVPPDIIDDGTSSDVTVHEGENVTLVCKATGHPEPKIVWRREDGEHIMVKKPAKDIFKGDTLSLTKLERRQMGAYLCIASNEVPPAVSKRINLNINFAPKIKVPNQLLGAPLGTDVQLECYVEAYPNTINYWVKYNGHVILPGTKHIVLEERSSYKIHMKLIVKAFNESDLGIYLCTSSNSLGRDEGTIRLYEIKIPTTPPPTTTVTTHTTGVTRNEITSTEQSFRQTTKSTTVPKMFTVIDTSLNSVELSSNELTGSSSRRRSGISASQHHQPTILLIVTILFYAAIR
uniref:Ig-like domain-containing protein n=1 Tax=Clastoptera arizonana TaxID=38151 RepID=A0A1B6DBF6_9HEMI